MHRKFLNCRQILRFNSTKNAKTNLKISSQKKIFSEPERLANLAFDFIGRQLMFIEEEKEHAFIQKIPHELRPFGGVA